MKQVQMIMTIEQAEVVKNALDLYSRIGAGQLEEVERVLMTQFGFTYKANVDSKEDLIECNWKEFSYYISGAKACIGFSRNGSYGISHSKISKAALRAYEIFKAVCLTLAIDKDPNPFYKTVDYDGAIVRYTSDPTPTVTIIKEEGE